MEKIWLTYNNQTSSPFLEMKKNYNLDFKKDKTEYPMDISQLKPKKDEIIRKIKFICCSFVLVVHGASFIPNAKLL